MWIYSGSDETPLFHLEKGLTEIVHALIRAVNFNDCYS